MDATDEPESMATECEEEEKEKRPSEKKVYIPEVNVNQANLECDMSAYVMYHQAKTLAPCLSFDIIHDELGDERTEFPMTMYMVAGSQAAKSKTSHVIVMKMSNLHKVKPEKDSSDDDDDEASDEEMSEEESPVLMAALIKHEGCVNRLRTEMYGNRALTASWSELGIVHIWDISTALQAVESPQKLKKFQDVGEDSKPLFSFPGHQVEGYAMDWSSIVPGQLATGDCNKNIHLWKPNESCQWIIDQRPFVGHTASVEDIQWSPNEANVFSSCSVDRSVRVWDARAAPNKACMLTVENAHENDVNVISWNKTEPFIVSGGDDGMIKVWDLRQFKATSNQPVATFKHHLGPISSVEWHPSDSTVFAASGADNQLTIWDLAVEVDDAEANNPVPELQNIPPQLLFIHQGQTDIKELHWHPQVPGTLISTAQCGFNIFKTISV